MDLIVDKYDIQDITSNIDHLRPITFKYNSDESNKLQYGLITEEVEQYYPDLVITKQLEDGTKQPEL